MSKSSEVVLPDTSAYAMVQAATTDAERFQAGQYAIATVEVPGLDGPVPRFMFDMPWSDDDDDVVDQILARLASAKDMEQATNPQELTDPYDVVDHPVTIHGVIVRESDVEDSKWGAYLSLTCSVDGKDPEVINTGAGQVCVTVWRLYCDGQLPARGRFVLLGRPVKGRKQPLGFALESEL